MKRRQRFCAWFFLVLGGELELTNLKKSMVQGRERKLPLPMKNAANAHQII